MMEETYWHRYLREYDGNEMCGQTYAIFDVHHSVSKDKPEQHFKQYWHLSVNMASAIRHFSPFKCRLQSLHVKYSKSGIKSPRMFTLGSRVKFISVRSLSTAPVCNCGAFPTAGKETGYFSHRILSHFC